MPGRKEFGRGTQQQALARQSFLCASCGTRITRLGEAGREDHAFGESAHAHHVQHAKFGGPNSLANCVVLCQACHYSAHEGGNYVHGSVVGTPKDFPYYRGK